MEHITGVCVAMYTDPNETIETKIARVARRIINGAEVKYDIDLHVPMLISVFKEGRDISVFLCAAEITESTFHCWVRDHAEFKVAYEIAKFYARTWWEEFGRYGASDPSFNTKYWSMIMRNRFDLTEHRKLKVPGLKTAKDFCAQIQCLIDHISDGNLTGSEAQQLSNLILAAVKVKEVSETEKRMEMLEEKLESHK